LSSAAILSPTCAETPGHRHAERRPAVGDRLLGHERALLVDRAPRGHEVLVVEGGEVEALAEDEDVGHDVAASSGDPNGTL
jgi:hypothetical protein